MSEKVLNDLYAIMKDENADKNDRIKAAEMILEMIPPAECFIEEVDKCQD